ncbi:MAG: monovalent cation:proton antiporter-2 (CPA2) family protein [Rhodospirillaceae bacterium]|nr:monovalent cation:proton antiporter-2 (CPA2) family protein [Rhodospirillaceae bacterium]
MVEILSLLAAAVTAVLLFNRLGLGSVLGYLAAGAVVGPAGLALVQDPDNMRHIGELGVVFLLFLIGIEIKPKRLWVMRRMVFGFGGAQVIITGIILAGASHFIIGTDYAQSFIIGFGLALSSTAFGLQILSDENQMSSRWGRSSFAILLFQDLAVVPLMVVISILGAETIDPNELMGLAVLESVFIFLAVLIVGHYAINPILHAIARSKNSDAFVAAALLLVLGFAWAMEQIGLSMAMGAFIAGVMLSESEYRHQVEADVLPFRGLLLGLFFMSVGMTLDPITLAANWQIIIAGTMGMMALKIALIAGMARIAKLSFGDSMRAGFLLSQAGEFGFVLFSLAGNHYILQAELVSTLLSIIVISMAMTPLMVRVGSYIAMRIPDEASEIMVDNGIDDLRPVLIAGFGRVGRTVAILLKAANIPCIAIDLNADNVTKGRNDGFQVFFGNASRPDVLRAAGARNARLMVITLDNPNVVEMLVKTMNRLHPNVPIHARAHDWNIVDRFEAMGIAHSIPDTVESSLRLGAAALEASGVSEEDRCALFDELSAENYAKLRSHKNQ